MLVYHLISLGLNALDFLFVHILAFRFRTDVLFLSALSGFSASMNASSTFTAGTLKTTVEYSAKL